MVLTLVTLSTNSVLACTCGPHNPPFCEVAVNQNLFMARIIGQQEALSEFGYSAFFTNVEIIDFMNTTGVADTVSMINSDGLNCNDYIFDLAIGDTLIISIGSTEVVEFYDPQEFENYPEFNTYHLFGCGKFFLEVRDAKVGGMSENQDIIELADFLANPQENCPQITNTQNPLEGQIAIYPNPVSNRLNISTTATEKMSCTIFDITGVAVRQFSIWPGQNEQLPLDNIPVGTYILKMTDGLHEYSQLIIRQ